MLGEPDFLMRALQRNGFANIGTSRASDDGLTLNDAYILSVVRCAPPDNKPLPEEIARCRPHLTAELAALPRLQVVVALGKIGFDGYLAHLAESFSRARVRPRPAFAHGCQVVLPVGPPVLLGAYHPSRQNTNTGKLTPAMLETVFRRARSIIDSAP
ncbi:MAG TPA: uracil-DNA glycosylase family protein [Polyangia bacterium]|nr:uracil-DNA glycosylase family protein [Polyangia bacterium]